MCGDFSTHYSQSLKHGHYPSSSWNTIHTSCHQSHCIRKFTVYIQTIYFAINNQLNDRVNSSWHRYVLQVVALPQPWAALSAARLARRAHASHRHRGEERLPLCHQEECRPALHDTGNVLQVVVALSCTAGIFILASFVHQALVTTELQVQGNPTCFHGCMSSLLRLARSAAEQSRSHALHILRALFRNSALQDSVAPYVGGGLVVALQGFDGDTWAVSALCLSGVNYTSSSVTESSSKIKF